jgi:GxxExxY protein
LNGNELTREIIGATIEVHRHLGPGLLESAYEACLAVELDSLGLQVERQKELPVRYKGRKIDAGNRIDLLVSQQVILELKSVRNIEPIHEA